MNKVQVIGTGSYVPPRAITNEDLSRIVDTSDEWISSRTGIKERRISEGEDTSNMATKAVVKALENSGVVAEDIDLIIVATITPDCFTPSVACMVQSKINAVNATCFDISAACAGLVYGLNIATQFIRTGIAKTALVIGAETLSKIVNWKDRNTCVLFGDGASAVMLKNSQDREGILAVYSGSEGSKGYTLTCEAAPVDNPYIKEEDETIDLNNKIKMDGREVFKFGVRSIIQCTEKLLEHASCSLEDIKYIVPHQANYRIIELAAKKLGISEDRFYLNLNKYGNTSGASVGIALDEMNEKGLINKGDKILLIGFGGGLTYGGLMIQW
ncbi:beta-ketoacyl-ACP synthase III [Clostridium sp. DJ247]|uniref:beta-ketoacyl-ACP synthase III n=1 Tax=Clostridium sp. DJ247 TaxID=2726188 RepID=UPI0016273C61|nr:beta-ketoacyl-ACP synthase III [Clostridium sp. DJ247]MBC2580939.1 ketoacyl-ACP synthase III [Clostridium sp. DJ247]